MSFYAPQITRRTKGQYAVRLSEGYQVYILGETTLKRLQEVFPGASIYIRMTDGWVRNPDEVEEILKDIEKNRS